ncbi:MAG: hypothetical protein PHH22_01060 [Clostridia bacterium]|nr:hypothetical protein [Clostridia bacterium]
MKKGNSLITVPIMLVFSIVVLITIGTLLLNIIQPYIMYEKLLSITLKYMFVLEEYGYLNSNDIQNIVHDLALQGFDRNNIVINATNTLQEYGDNVFLDIHYTYYMNVYMILPNSLIVRNNLKEVPMHVVKYGVSKR